MKGNTMPISRLNPGSVTKFASCRGITDFPYPSHLPSGQSLISLRDAGTYITKIPKAEHDTPACKQPIMEGRLNCTARRDAGARAQ
jgi:hypothetical protein